MKFSVQSKIKKKNCPFWAEGWVLEQNSRKLTPLRIQFYFQFIITLTANIFFNAWQWHKFDFDVIFTLFCFLNWLFAAKFSNCSNLLNFGAKINCNTIKPNVSKWRKTCTGLKFDLLHFYGPQSHILSGDTFEGPCSSKLLHTSGTCPGDGSHYYWYIRFFTCAPVGYHIK